MNYRILTHESLNSKYFHLRLLAPEIAQTAAPGQFVMIKVTTCHQDPLLRRPISVMDADPSTGILELLYSVVGKGTRLLSTGKAGDCLDIVGPQETASIQSPDTTRHCWSAAASERLLWVIWLEFWHHGNVGWDICVSRSSHSGDDIVCENKFEQYGATVYIATENGEKGSKGLVTEPLISFLCSVAFKPGSVCLWSKAHVEGCNENRA